MIRLGCAVRALGPQAPQIGSWHAPLSISLLWLRSLFAYMQRVGAGCYRLPAEILPLGRHAVLEDIASQLAANAELLAEIGSTQPGLRLSFHPGLHMSLATSDFAQLQRVAAELALYAQFLDLLGAGPEGVIVLHIGSTDGGIRAALDRFALHYCALPDFVRRRVAVEHDQHRFDLETLLGLHQRTGVPLIFDSLHHQLYNPACIPLREALGLALASWPMGVRPKIHLSSQRTEAHVREARSGQAARIIAPRRGQHADFLNPFEVAQIMVAARGLPPFDIMLEAKAADLALIRLRDDLHIFAPESAQLLAPINTYHGRQQHSTS